MSEDPESTTEGTLRKRLVERLGSMVASGRVTEDEAGKLRAARGTGEFDEVVRSIRVRHARTRLETAVADGSLSREEADGSLDRLKAGEHPRSLRAHLGKLRPRRGTPEA
ncbi:MAG: hypothetical protein M3Y04_00840 [Actinomycetota bacterium]|nr:hypothetical protein [Actinomycetota bacterium]